MVVPSTTGGPSSRLNGFIPLTTWIRAWPSVRGFLSGGRLSSTLARYSPGLPAASQVAVGGLVALAAISSVSSPSTTNQISPP